jgi:hypothetical protein
MERRQTGVLGGLWFLFGLVFGHAPISPDVRSDAQEAIARKARNMAADKPAKAPTLYEAAVA